ncbi:MAG TPA: secretin N-terminal domain-containing protein, partial [Steroidobacteraceae bacterium]|nr:secretin N-terminal domain-containing protein [Steroidobacteraceae bacterium]
MTLITGCAAERLHREGLAAVEAGDYETGVADLSQALARQPNNNTFRLDLQARRESAVQALIAEADRARLTGQFDGAAALYRRVLALDPGNDRARRGLDNIDADKRHTTDVQAARKDFEKKDFDAAEAKVRAVLSEDPGFVLAQELASDINGARRPVAAVPHLHPRGNQKVSLQLRDAPTKMVFEVSQRETGINFILDKDVKSDSKTTIFVQDVPVEEAIELVLEQNQLSRNILADNMVMIYPNTAAKQKDYEQQIVRIFYLTNAAPKDVESMLKTVLGAKTLFINEQANMLVMRDTPDAVRMAEKLVTSLDVTEPEVMLEVEVLEISSSRLQDLGIQYPTALTLTPSPLTAAAAGATTGGLVLSDLSHQNSHTIGINSISVTVNAMKQAGAVKTLASPRIRARNKEKAKVLIGTREPVITNSVTPTAAGAPVVTGSVQYLDVGLTLDVQPTVYLDNDVGIKISLEVSSLLKQVTTASGTVAYEIGTRNASTLLRLKDGETQILAGLIQDSDTRTANTIPLIGEVPILSHLFGTHHTDREKDEIVLSITPRIIRMQPRPAADSTEFWYGSESRLRARPLFSSEPSGAASPAGSAAPPAPLQVPSGSPMPGSGMQPISPSVAPGSVSAPLSGTPQTGEGASLAPAAPPPAPQGLATTTPPAAIAAAEPTAARGAAADAPGPSALTVTGPAEAKVG